MQTVMGQIDEQKERKRLAELYAGMEKGELEEIPGDAGSLTPVAKEVLRSEMLSRGMDAPSASAGAAETSAGNNEPPSPVVIARYGGVLEAVLAKSMLDSAGIESFLGDENLVRLDSGLVLLEPGRRNRADGSGGRRGDRQESAGTESRRNLM